MTSKMAQFASGPLVPVPGTGAKSATFGYPGGFGQLGAICAQ
jgi:hypothetical protein